MIKLVAMIIKNIIAVAMAMSVTAVYAQSEDSDSETSYARGVVNYEPEVARGVINLDANDYEKEENDAQSSVRGVVIDKAKMKEGVDKAIGIDWVICDVSKGRLFTDVHLHKLQPRDAPELSCATVRGCAPAFR